MAGRSSAPNVSEDDVEKRLGELLLAAFGDDFLYFKFKPFGIIGVPDRILLLKGGKLVFIELKKPKGSRVFPWQRRMHANLRRLGFRIELIYTYDQVAGLVDHLLYD